MRRILVLVLGVGVVTGGFHFANLKKKQQPKRPVPKVSLYPTSKFFVQSHNKRPLLYKVAYDAPHKETKPLPMPKEFPAIHLDPIPAERLEPIPIVKRASRLPILVTPEKHKLYSLFWPKSDQEWLDDLKNDVIYYTELELPQVYQVWDQGRNLSGVRSINTSDKNANQEFPWRDAMGLQESSNYKVIRLARFPSPVLWWKQATPKGNFDSFKWEYPPGTVFGEILLVTDLTGKDHTFEMRVREKRDDGTWEVDAFRPFPTEDSLKEALAMKGLSYPELQGGLQTIDSRGQPTNHRRGFGFLASAQVVNVPTMDAELVTKLLDESVFTSAHSKAWRKSQISCFAPTTSDNYNIVPKNYLAAFVRVDSKSCMQCHQDAGQFVPAGPEPVNQQTEARWRLRGNDGIFSFHIFDANGLRQGELRLNPKLVASGLLKHKEGMP